MLTPLLWKVCKEGREKRYLPIDWKTGYLVKLPEKSRRPKSLQQLARNSGPFLSTPSKISSRIILERLNRKCFPFKITTETDWLAGWLQEEQIMCRSNCNAALRYAS
ncbi:unnamed protein product [Heterobilharzia americana]|nr:unnamed protein product [Heterobilharzia americana]